MDQCSLWRRRTEHSRVGRCLLAIAILLVTLSGAAVVADVPVRNSPVEAIFGEWQIVEMVHKGKVQDLSAAVDGCWIKLEKEHFAISFFGRDFRFNNNKEPCKIGEGVLDIQDDKQVLKARYEYNDDKLRIVWRDDYGDRPADFDALGDPRLTLFVLKRAED